MSVTQESGEVPEKGKLDREGSQLGVLTRIAASLAQRTRHRVQAWGGGVAWKRTASRMDVLFVMEQNTTFSNKVPDPPDG